MEVGIEFLTIQCEDDVNVLFFYFFCSRLFKWLVLKKLQQQPSEAAKKLLQSGYSKKEPSSLQLNFEFSGVKMKKK